MGNVVRLAFIALLLAATSCRHGAEPASEPLAYTSWKFVEIGGQATELTGDLLRDDRYAVDFGADGMVGYGGCNRFTASYTRAGNVLTITLLGSTRRACSERIMAIEHRLFTIFRTPLRISFSERRTMILTGEGGSIRLRRSAEPDR